MNWVLYTLVSVLSASASGAADDGLHDIKGPARIALPLKEALIITGGIIAVLLLLWFLVRLYKKRKEKPVTVERVLTPEEQVMKRLNDPALKAALEKGDFRFFYFAVSDAIREYIAGRYSIDAMDCTTFELLSELGRKSESAVIFSSAEDFFSQCDLVKFAKFRPSVEEAKESLNQALNIVTVCEEFFLKKARLEADKMTEARPA